MLHIPAPVHHGGGDADHGEGRGATRLESDLGADKTSTTTTPGRAHTVACTFTLLRPLCDLLLHCSYYSSILPVNVCPAQYESEDTQDSQTRQETAPGPHHGTRTLRARAHHTMVPRHCMRIISCASQHGATPLHAHAGAATARHLRAHAGGARGAQRASISPRARRLRSARGTHALRWVPPMARRAAMLSSLTAASQ